MKAVRNYGIRDVRFEDIEKVVPKPEEALIKVDYAGICGSDLHIYREGMFVEDLPETMGHEFVGHIVSAPDGSGFKAGDAVTGDPRIVCGKCRACRDGAYPRCENLAFIGEARPGCFAEYVALEPEKLILLKEPKDLKQAALIEPLAVAVHACKRMDAAEKEKALIVGGGPIGLLIAAVLNEVYHLKSVAVADIDEYRQGVARAAGLAEVGPDLTVYAPEADIIVDAAGSGRALDLMIQHAKHGSRLYISAIYEKLPVVDLNAAVSKEMKLIGSNNYDREDLEEAARLITEAGMDLSWIISSVLFPEQAAEGFERLAGAVKKDMKILFRF